ncbi:hypothetical protein K9L67_05450 [Candidatus Woesearchaeota archaeon]|nr:hypothetical protein [Candidatus Woesearchaeota archaeon]MCF7901644.1 hypothetical protein [Candidatus Woesearchaeota archaeon]MCF8013262.1 hypothetical protein [Candidatus Woesearchaeota archaeon]
MSNDIVKKVEEGLRSNLSLNSIKNGLLKEGYSEDDIDGVVKNLSTELGSLTNFNTNVALFKKKFFLDKVGFGLASNQFINILFSFTGAGIFLLGLVNVLRSFFNTLFSSFFREYFEKFSVKKSLINFAGLVFGFSFLFIALAVSINSKILFAVSLIIGAIGVVIYGDLFNTYKHKSAGNNKSVLISPGLAWLGLFVTFIGMVVSGFLMDVLPRDGTLFSFSVFGHLMDFRLHGFLLAFEATTIVFILSSYLLSKIKFPKFEQKYSFDEFKIFLSESIVKKGKIFFKNKYLVVLSLAALFFGVFQTIFYSTVGVYIFNNYGDFWFGGFTNIAIIFGVPVVISIFGPLSASKLNKYFGLSPLLVFASLLSALFPFAIIYNGFLPAIFVAAILGVFGASIVGYAQSMIASKLLNDYERRIFYSYSSLIMVVPYLLLSLLILVLFGFSEDYFLLFKVVMFGIVFICMPLFLLLVFWSRNRKISDA